MEYVDILDEKGNKTGLTKSRKDAHIDGDWHKVAFIFVVNDKGEIILQKRSDEKETNPNKWTASASGHLSAGDTDIEGAIRELEEEIGIQASAEDLKYLFTVNEKHIKEVKNLKIRHIADVYLLYRNIELSSLVLQQEEVSDVKYVHYKDFEKMLLNDEDNIVAHDEIYSGVLKELQKKFNI